MNRYPLNIYMSLGTIFGIVLAAPAWYAALFEHAPPSGQEEVKSVVVVLLVATLKGILRSIAWLPSLVYNVGMHKIAFETWLLHGWW